MDVYKAPVGTIAGFLNNLGIAENSFHKIEIDVSGLITVTMPIPRADDPSKVLTGIHVLGGDFFMPTVITAKVKFAESE